MSFQAAQEIMATTENITSLLPVAAIVFPLLGSFIVFLAGLYSARLRNVLAVLTALVTFGIVMSIYPYVQQGPLVYHFADVMNYGLYFRADFVSFVFAVLFAGSWLLATIYATVYMKEEHAQNRFYFFLIFTLAHCLGIVLAGDLFSLFLFFELMTFSSYVLIIHRQTPAALRAGSITIYMGVAGGLALLMGIFIMYWGLGTLEIAPMLEEILASGINPLVVIPLFMVGFGTKMGMVPLHIWLPRAYEEGPSPVNAISSAVMLKAGAYGLIRVMGMIFTPADPTVEIAGAEIMTWIGFATIWFGLITMVVGAGLAMLQNNAKRILGCSSISQMGYILMSIGVAVFLGYDRGGVGFAGAMYHIINHSIFKASLFFTVGAVYLITKDVDISRIGGMAKKVPFLLVTFMIAYIGIAGIPGGNGYASKAIMHRAIDYSYTYGGQFTSLWWGEKIYVLASAMTVVYFAKLLNGLFLGRTKPEQEKLDFSVSPLIKAVLGVFAAGILAIGLFPNFILNNYVIPASAGFTFDPYVFDSLREINFFLWYDLKEPLIVLGVAAVMYLFLDHTRGFQWKAPEWFSIEYVFFLPLSRFFLNTCCNFGASFDSGINKTYLQTGKIASNMCKYVSNFDSSINDAYEKSGNVARRLAERTEHFDSSLNEAYEKSGEYARRMADKSADFDGSPDEVHEHSGEDTRSLWDKMRGRPSDWNIKNLNFDSLLMALMLGLFLFILIYYNWIN
ncbi:complex I subunit 5 family protein [Dethiobacter alkaliphilus]|uniref:NADH dehydrogenase (Quinone) n=1 Tax=Dethiobacter alkaliphilus AHT 1 TaxID=555088 RepID=C0GEW9_DETAL|nr:proton-conducting transporter membrane subunit [Dethiobacter alkaliphilus]EEG78151.1 NADH dehydrogenase (quinone) [Dethiobacter alkaliphilus AHT 1]